MKNFKRSGNLLNVACLTENFASKTGLSKLVDQNEIHPLGMLRMFKTARSIYRDAGVPLSVVGSSSSMTLVISSRIYNCCAC